MINKISQTELDAKLELHKEWLNSNRTNGQTFTAFDFDFSGLNFENANLVGGNLVGCNFSKAQMYRINMESLNVTESDFSDADLSFSNLRHCDFRRVTINEYTNFIGADTTGMLVDKVTLERLPSEINKSKLQVFDANTIFVAFKYQKEEQKFIAEGIINTFDEYIRNNQTTKDVKTSFKSEKGRFIYTIDAEDVEEKEWIEEKKEKFAMVVANKMTIQEFTNDPIEQRFIRQRLERLTFEYIQVSQLAEDRRMQLALANNEIIAIRKSLNEVVREKNLLYDSIEMLKAKNNIIALPKPKVTFRAEFSDAQYIDIESDTILYVEKEKVVTETVTHEIQNTISDIEEQLLRNPNFVIGNKGLLVNVSKVTRQENEKNDVIAYFKEGSERMRVKISQTRKDKFKDLYRELHKKK